MEIDLMEGAIPIDVSERMTKELKVRLTSGALSAKFSVVGHYRLVDGYIHIDMVDVTDVDMSSIQIDQDLLVEIVNESFVDGIPDEIHDEIYDEIYYA